MNRASSNRPLSTLRSGIRFFTDDDPVIAALAVLLIIYYCATRGIYQGKASGDGFFGFMYLPALVFHHSLDIGPTVPQWVSILGRGPSGHVQNACPIGPVVFWLPTYLIALTVESVLKLLHQMKPEALPGQTVFDFWMAGLGSLMAGIAGIAILFRLLTRKLGTSAARVGVIVAVLATPLTWYLITQPLYQHACAFLAVTLLVERWDAWRDSELTPKRLAMLGALGGVAMLMRLQEAIWLLLPGMDAFLAILQSVRKRDWQAALTTVKGGILMALCALAVFSPQLLLWHWLSGAFHPPQPPGHMRWSDPALVATVFSTRGGLLPWTPVLYLLLPGLTLARKPLSGLAGRLGLLFLIELWVNAAAWDHWGSWTYGPRRFTDATVTFALAFGGLWWWVQQGSEVKPGRKILRAAIGLCFCFGIALNGLCMELVRTQKIKSSGSGAYPYSTWAHWAKGPAWLTTVFNRVGFPFVQPAGLIYGLVYQVPLNTFEGVVGSYFLDRDSRIHAVIQTPSLSFKDPGLYVPEGFLPAPSQPSGKPEKPEKSALVPVAERVRVLIPLFAREPLKLHLIGAFNGQEARVLATWNGTPLVAHPSKTRVSFDVPESLVHTRSRTNELVLTLPPGSALGRLDFESLGNWWR